MTVGELYKIFDFPVEIKLIKNKEQLDCAIDYEDEKIKSVRNYCIRVQQPIVYVESDPKLILKVQI